MSRIYLVRHGQAGTRQAYDSLSDIGRQQARLLGEHFLAEGLRFDAVYRGAMCRQEMTAAEVARVYLDAGVLFPEIAIEPGWNEFDLDHIYTAMAPLMCEADPEFRREYEEMRAAADSPDAAVHRRWLPCDTKMVRAWLFEQFPYEGESWKAFHERVASQRHSIEPVRADANILVFTSATPIGVWTALTMDVHDQRAMKLAGVVHNTAYTVIRLHGDELRLHTFNAVPHLSSVELRTHR